jgi:hypothetical protein
VDFKNDHDQIDVGRSEGRFKQLEVRVKNAPIEIYDMVVTCGNDTTFKHKLLYKFSEKSASRIIDLPANVEPLSESISITRASIAAKAKELLKCAGVRTHFIVASRGRRSPSASPSVDPDSTSRKGIPHTAPTAVLQGARAMTRLVYQQEYRLARPDSSDCVRQ